jgi:3-oxo-5-alpha-steroid 4-dehydrogenase 1
MQFNQEDFYTIVYIWIAIAIVIFPIALFVTAPYGRHTKKIGKMIPNKLGWILMEIPSPVLCIYFFVTGIADKTMFHYLFVSLFVLHYLNRTFVWPLRTRTKGKKMPLMIAFSAIFFNLINGSINGYYLGNFASYEVSWLYDPRFIIGMVLFLLGAYINISSDNILLKLRKPGETGYKVPEGGMFKYASAPNLLGEIIEWTGYAVATWSIPTASFAIWTFANLIPRGIDHHKWYLRNFKDYPKERKAIIPKIW